MARTMNIKDYIPVGHENAVSRQYLCSVTGLTDRKLREEIAKARETTCICNSSDGKGYYIPSTVHQAIRYQKQEMSRNKSIARSLRGTKKFIYEHSCDGQISLDL